MNFKSTEVSSLTSREKSNSVFMSPKTMYSYPTLLIPLIQNKHIRPRQTKVTKVNNQHFVNKNSLFLLKKGHRSVQKQMNAVRVNFESSRIALHSHVILLSFEMLISLRSHFHQSTQKIIIT